MSGYEVAVGGIYTGGIALWVAMWRMVNGYRLMTGDIRLLWVPFVTAIVTLAGNMALWALSPSVGPVELEEGLFQFLDNRTANVVSATGSVLVIATIIYGVSHERIPKAFIRYNALSFICFLGFSTPILWIPTHRPEWLMLLRHYQTIPFTYGLFLSVAGILVLLESLGVDFPDRDPSPG